jgi:DNA replicative helicase MCM subunit Mcm2 (Cdc46/Mcm family)
LKGATEGLRNESAIRLASFWLNFCKEAPEKAKTQLSEWNLRNKPSMEETELETTFQSTMRGGYNYSCEDQILKSHCPKEGCKLRKREPVEIRLAELRAAVIDQPVKVKAQVIGESDKMACCRKALIECLNCGTQEVIDLAEPRNYKLLLERLRLGQNKFKQSLYSFHVCGCEKAKRKVSLEGYLDYRRLYCQDLIDPKEKWEERTYRTTEVILIGEPKEAAMKKIELNGIAITIKRDKDSIMVYKVEPLEKPVPSSMEGFEQYFKNNQNLIEDLDRTIEPYIQGRPTEKLVASLVLHSPYQLMFEGRLTRGSIYAMFLGETKTGKSDILEWIEKNVGGEGVRAEAATRAGVAWCIMGEKNDVLVWGALPRCDKEIVLLDGMDKFDMEDLGKMREALASQELTVHMAVHGKALCRGRILASANPKKTVFERKYKTLAESIIELFESNTTLVTRWDAFVPFKRADVEVKAIAKAKASEPKIPLEIFRNHVFWAWSLEPEDVQFSEEAEAEIETVFETLETQYASDSNPLVHSEYKNVLARFSAAYAVLTHSVNGAGKVIVTKDHVSKAHDLLWRLLEAWEYDWYVSDERGKLDIDAQEMADLMGFLTDDVWKIFSAIAKTKGLQRAVILTMIDASQQTVDRYLNEMKKKDLIQHAKGFRGGYELIDKGVIIYRKIMMAPTEKQEHRTKLPPVDQILSIEDLKPPEEGKCAFCGREGVLYYMVQGFKEAWGLACQDCGETIKRQFGEKASEA